MSTSLSNAFKDNLILREKRIIPQGLYFLIKFISRNESFVDLIPTINDLRLFIKL